MKIAASRLQRKRLRAYRINHVSDNVFNPKCYDRLLWVAFELKRWSLCSFSKLVPERHISDWQQCSVHAVPKQQFERIIVFPDSVLNNCCKPSYKLPFPIYSHSAPRPESRLIFLWLIKNMQKWSNMILSISPPASKISLTLDSPMSKEIIFTCKASIRKDSRNSKSKIFECR